MKVFCFALIVNIVFLLTQPCQDMIAMADDCGDRKTQVAHIEKSTATDLQSDDCSPFCICSCCSISVADRSLPLVVTSAEANPNIATTLASYETPAARSFHNSIWQPPKA